MFFVIGDAAHVPWRDGMTVPGIAPAAKQQGKYVGGRIIDHMRSRETPPFAYRPCRKSGDDWPSSGGD